MLPLHLFRARNPANQSDGSNKVKTPSAVLQRPLLDSNVSVIKSTHCWTVGRSDQDFYLQAQFEQNVGELSYACEAKYQLSPERFVTPF